MNSKGQITTGGLLIAFIGVIVAITLLTGGITSNVGTVTSTNSYVNQSLVMPTNGSYTDIDACVNYAGTPIILNRTGYVAIPTTNYTVTTRVSPTSSLKVLTVYLAPSATAYSGVNANITYTCLPQGYAEDSASRTIFGLVIIFSCLAVAVFVLYFGWKNIKELI